MRKLIVLSMVLIAILVGCSSGDGAASAPTAASTTTAASTSSPAAPSAAPAAPTASPTAPSAASPTAPPEKMFSHPDEVIKALDKHNVTECNDLDAEPFLA